MGVCNCSMFCCMLLYVHSSIAIILMGKGELVALLNLSSWCLVMVEQLFLAVPWGCLRFVIVVFPDHTHLLILPWNTFPGGLKTHFVVSGESLPACVNCFSPLQTVLIQIKPTFCQAWFGHIIGPDLDPNCLTLWLHSSADICTVHEKT